MSSRQVISSAVAPVYNEASFTSEMVTQGLMFEFVSILDKRGNWCNIKMEDGYEGWINTFYLSESQLNSTNSVMLTNRYTPLRNERSIDDQIIALLSFGTVVPLIEKTSGYCKIQLVNGQEGFIPSHDNIVSESRNDIILLASVLLGVPYLWGGKSSFGYDCSGFVQMVLKVAGIQIPRDTVKQIQSNKLEEISMNDTGLGDLVYFSQNERINHVAFTTGEGKIIHCSGKVKIESIMEGEPGFNSKLAKMEHTFMSIKEIVSL